MKNPITVDFNKDYANKISKADFIKAHKHHEQDVDLGQAWENLQDNKSKDVKNAPQQG